MADSIQFTNTMGIVILLVFAAIYLGSSYLYQKSR